MKLHYIAIDNSNALRQNEALLQKAWHLHRQLRPKLESFEQYCQLMEKIIASHARLILVSDDVHVDELIGLALFRMHHNTYQYKLFFLEDIVVDDARRGQGYGSEILRHCEAIAKQHGCEHIALDSGTFRPKAHKLYFDHDYIIESYHFTKKL